MTPNSTITSFDRTTRAPQPMGGIALVTGILAILGFASAAIFLYFGISQSSWQFFVNAGGMFLTGFLSAVILFRVRTGRASLLDLGWLSLVFSIALILISIFIAGMALACAIIFLIFSLSLTSLTASTATRGSTTIILGLVFSTGMAISGAYLTGLQINLPEISVFIPGLLSVVIMIYITLLVIQFVSAPLQTRLTTAFLAMVIVPLGIGALVLNQASLSRVRTETLQGLSATASEVASVLDRFINNKLDAVRQQADMDAFTNYLSPNPNPSQGKDAQLQMEAAIRLLQTQESSESTSLSSYALLDAAGVNVYDTDKGGIGRSEFSYDYFQQPMQTGRNYYSPIRFDEQGNGFVYFSAPVKDNSRQKIIGVLRQRYSALIFQRLAVNYAGLLGKDSHVVIIDENMLRLADTYQPNLIFKTIDAPSAAQLKELQTQGRLPPTTNNFSAFTASSLSRLLRLEAPTGTAFLNFDQTGAGDNLPEMIAYATMSLNPWKILYLKANYDQRPVEEDQSRTTVLIASIVSLIVGLISIGISRILASPLISLTNTAEKLSTGNLEVRAEFTGNDEYGTLSSAFNLMTQRMRSFIDDLEGTVNRRTQELKQRNEILVFRSNQLRTVAEVARSIVTSQDLDSLLDSITTLISARFGFYHVGIFLVDDRNEFAVLRAANSEGGKRMLARNHKLEIGRIGIVGYVTGTGEPRIATDVGEDATYFNNPDLPLTRSEMALPLRVGNQIIGALDVQSTDANSFSQDDIDLFSTLADQVSVAIYNNRLYNETVRALGEAEATHQRYLQKEWTSDLATRKNRAYRYTPLGLEDTAESIDVHQEGLTPGHPTSVVETQPDGSGRLVMTVPILERGVTIGAIRIQDQRDDRTWTEDERLSVQSIAQQVGSALETARLFEKTVQRAEREQKVLEITSKIRSTNDPQEMLAIAAAELQKALGATRAQISLAQAPAQPGPQGGGNGQDQSKKIH